jgi:hypothetical protein
MRAKHRTEITYEAHETTVIRYGRGQTTVYCRQCEMYTPNLSVEQAMPILAVTSLAIERSIREGKVHAIEGSGDPPMLCGNSLRQLLHRENTNE